MIPSTAFTHAYVGIFGENTLLAFAQSNLLSNLDRVRKVRTHTFLANNGQTREGASCNAGHWRFYSWQDTLIDCRNAPGLTQSSLLEDFPETIAENYKFKLFRDAIVERSGEKLFVTPFYHVMKGEENMRYNIRCDSRIEDFDIIRVGVEVMAESEEDFAQGLNNIRISEIPFRVVGLPMVN
ncbi:MAG: hypothetical protein KDI13_10500 [Alphaproteobacteria bacterium]|nr:hypothetical protein [Alphaproteobacteria bacterium]